MPTSILVLPSCPAAFKGEPVSAVACAAAPLSRKVEPVGRAFQATKHPAPKPSSAEEDAAAAALASPTGVQLRDAKYDRYKKFDIDLGDYYTLLGLEEKMFDATKDEITEAYRTMCKVRERDGTGWGKGAQRKGNARMQSKSLSRARSFRHVPLPILIVFLFFFHPSIFFSFLSLLSFFLFSFICPGDSPR